MEKSKVQVEFRGKPFTAEVSKREGFGWHVHTVRNQYGEELNTLAPVIDFLCQGQIAEVMEGNA